MMQLFTLRSGHTPYFTQQHGLICATDGINVAFFRRASPFKSLTLGVPLLACTRRPPPETGPGLLVSLFYNPL